jgi:predicted DNA-binding transcriptional regulator YafY
MSIATLESVTPSRPTVFASQADKREQLITRVMQQSDELVLVIEYSGKNGQVTRRVVSPIRWSGKGMFLALCLSREEPRHFHVERCRSIRVDLAERYVMPVELEVIVT